MFIQYLINQSKKPSGIVGQVIAKIWTSYFKKLSLWTIKQTTIIDNSRVLEIGYGGGSTIKNLLALNKHLEIHGIDISKESYQVAKRINSDAIQNGDVHLRIGNVDALPYQNDYFDLVFAIQTHIFWDDLKKGFLEIYRVMSSHSTLIIACDTCLSCNLRKRKKRLIWKFKSQSQKCVNNIFPSSFSHLIIFIETIL